jgi:hypothetical protein
MPFDPTAHPPLTQLGDRLRELAGDAAYRAGRDYLRKGSVHDAAVAETSAFATVKGSTDYRVTVHFPSVDATRVSCTCPAHRRRKHCKHVVAVCAALLEQPASFSVLDTLTGPPPTVPKAPRAARGKSGPKTQPAQLRTAGLDVLDRLLVELADGGVVQFGPDKAALIEQCAELVRALKLRRLGNLLMQLQRAVANPRTLDGSTFARLLLDLYLCRAATGAMLDGRVVHDGRLAEDLLGKTWRAEELEPISNLELVQVAASREDDGEFVIETSLLVDLGSLEIYAERQITPVRLRAKPKSRHRLRLLVEAAGLYPGLAPRRIRIDRYARAPLRSEDIDRLVDGALTDLFEVQRRLVERAAVPFGNPEVAVLFRPTVLLAPATGQSERQLGAVDNGGRFIAVELPSSTADNVRPALSTGDPVALFGLVSSGANGLVLRCLSVLGARPTSASRGDVSRLLPV